MGCPNVSDGRLERRSCNQPLQMQLTCTQLQCSQTMGQHGVGRTQTHTHTHPHAHTHTHTHHTHPHKYTHTHCPCRFRTFQARHIYLFLAKKREHEMVTGTHPKLRSISHQKQMQSPMRQPELAGKAIQHQESVSHLRIRPALWMFWLTI